MSAWAVVIGVERLEAERLFHHDMLELTGLEEQARPSAGDEVLVVTGDEPPLVVALGRVCRTAVAEDHDPDDPLSDDGPVPLIVAYTRRAFDEPVPADGLALARVVNEVDSVIYRELAGRLGAPPDTRTWLVSANLPIEAPSAAEATRLFWSYVMELGPRELPAFVSPKGDELAMQSFVLGEEANQDPEEDD